MKTRRSRGLRPVEHMARWKLEDAKARLSELVRAARSDGPQLVTSRGKAVAVILAPEQYEELLPKSKSQKPLMEFLQGLGLASLNVEREYDRGGEIAL